LTETTGPRASTAGYGTEADTLARTYESIAFEALHRRTLPLMPAPPARVIDIGAGTGRDAAALSRWGHRVTAVEPTAELRAHGERIHAGSAIRWIDDGLPDLERVRALGETFDLILMTAVFMHLDEGERAAGMAALARIAAPEGRLIMSLRHGPVPPGRRMFEVSGDEATDLGLRNGFRPIFRTEQTDMQGRPDVTWTILAFEMPQP
jgi:SAM-dependent methyltransferase